ncbi:MAG: hypothetical protein ACRD11_10430 [Terriglobia bacterium]
MKPHYGSTAADLEPASPERVREHVEKIERSKFFRNAPALQRLLNFVTAAAVSGTSDPLKEYAIASEVFGRGSDYDPKIDTVVRVEMHRLREKLREYYEADGANDALRIEIPKGHYLPSFDVRGSPTRIPQREQRNSSGSEKEFLQTEAGKVDRAGRTNNPPRSWSSRRAAEISFALLLFASGVFAGIWWARGADKPNSSGSPSLTGSVVAKPDPRVEGFWRDFLGKDTAPIIGYADAVFLIDETNDLFRFRRGASDARGAPVDPHLALRFASNPFLVSRAGPLFYEDGYTGTGELESIALLSRLFTEMGVTATVKRSREVSVDDLKEHSVILLGSSFQNEAVAQLPSGGDFVFDDPEPRRELWRGRILNLHPRAGESASYTTERDPVTQVVKTDYALITVKSAVPGRWIAVLGGLDTTGTEGATQFATSSVGVREIADRLQSLGAKIHARTPPSFQALLKVRLDNGQDVLGVHLVAVHLIHPVGNRDAATGR